MNNKISLLNCFCLLLTTSTFCSCLSWPLDDGDFIYPTLKDRPPVPTMRSSVDLVKMINETFLYHGSSLRVCFDGPDCNLYRLDFLRAGKKEAPIVCEGILPMEEVPFTEVLRRICEAYGMESDRRENVIHLKKKKSRILLEAEYERAN